MKLGSFNIEVTNTEGNNWLRLVESGGVTSYYRFVAVDQVTATKLALDELSQRHVELIEHYKEKLKKSEELIKGIKEWQTS